MKKIPLPTCFQKFVLIFLLFSAGINVTAQMRQVYLDNFVPGNEISKISFYSPSQGFVAFRDWIGFSLDSGKTFTPKYITGANTNTNGYIINTIAGFAINGVKAFDQNNITVFGDYGLVPAILQSTDGGNNFIIRYYSQFNSMQLFTGIKDVVFPQNMVTGYAVDADRVLKTTNQGINWNVVRTDPGSFFNVLNAVDNNTVIAASTAFTTNKILRTVNGGLSWSPLPLPSGPANKVSSVYFLNANIGWLCMYSGNNNNDYYIFKTIDAAATWQLQNNIAATPFSTNKMCFTDPLTGFALSGQNTVFKTLNGGAIWERLPRDNNYAYLGYSHNDLQVLSPNQLWAGGGHGLLEMSNNGGGTPIPGAYFLLDTTGVGSTGIVTLNNYSRTGYNYKWYVNNSLISTTYNTVYAHNITSYQDSIKLVVSNGSTSDSLIRYQYFNVPAPPVPTITSFTPVSGQTSSTITITGTNFIGVSSVKFGGTNAVSFNVISPTSITAVLDSTASGSVQVTTPYGTASLGGFTSLTPTITSFSPSSGGPGTVINVIGTGLTNGNNHVLKFGGVTAANFTFQSSTSLNGIVANGASGNITYQTDYGTATIAGFTFIPPPHINSFSPMQSDQGGTVVITGTGFTGVTAVKFGNTPAASFTFISPTSVSAVVGAGSSGKVFLTTPSGTDSLPGFIYTTPIITSFSPMIGGTGSIIQIAGTDFIGVNTVSFGGMPATSFVVNSPTSITAVVGAGSSGAVVISGSHGSVSSAGFVYSNIPIVNSFTPIAGVVGSVVQIQGSGFSTSPANNIVYFGAVKALVNSATSSVLSVTVPAYANYDYITVTTNGLTTSSNYMFTPSFSGGTLTNSTYTTPQDFPVKTGPRDELVADLDGDGKTDLIIKSDDTLSYYRNISTTQTVAFAPRIDIPIPGIQNAFKIADINGDGKQDIVFMQNYGLFILVNTSSTGTISFLSPLNTGIVLSGFVQSMAIDDISGDGKPDIVLLANSTFVIKNTTNGVNISFAAPMYLTPNTNNSPWSVTLADMDSDGKKDIITSNYYQTGNSTTNAVSIFKNTCINGVISFAPPVQFGTPGWYADIHPSDVNQDGKPDLIYSIYGYYNAAANTFTQGNEVGILKNIGSPGNFSFTGQVSSTSYGSGGAPTTFGIGDVNGDQKPDLIALAFEELGIVQNFSLAGNISFNNPVIFPVVPNAYSKVIVADLNGDGKPEIIIGRHQLSKITVFINKDSSTPVSVCVNSGTTLSSNVVSASYQWQVNSGSSFLNITNNLNYSGATTPNLVLSNIPQSFNNYQYRCTAGTVVGNLFVLTVNPAVIPSVSITSSSNNICSGTTVTFIAVPINGGTTPIYQWKINGINAGTNSITFTTSSLNNNDQVKVIMTGNAPCSNVSPVSSNLISMTVTSTVPSSVSISANTVSICGGSPVSFTATPVNGGSAPNFQWQINGINAGSNSPTFTTSSLVNNDAVKVIMTSNLVCAVPANVTSNILSITVNTMPIANAGPDVTICSGSSITLQGSGGTSYFWTPSTGLTNPFIANPVATPAVTTVYILNVSIGSCSSRDTLTVAVNGTVMPTVIISSSVTTICAGSPVVFTATPIGGGTAPMYQWQLNGANAGSNSPVFSTTSLANNDAVRVIMTSSLGCAIPLTATSNIITTNVNSIPNANAGPDVTICAGATTTLQGSGGGAYLWTPATGLSNPLISNPVATPASTTTYKLTVTNGTCSATDSVKVTVTAVTTPSVTITAGNTNICGGDNVTFSATVMNGGSNPVYQWKVNGINAGNNSATFTSSTLQNNDQVKVSLGVTSMCSLTSSVNSNSLSINVTSLTIPVVIANNNTFTVTDPAAAAAYTWQLQSGSQWFNIVPPATGISYIPTTAGVYRVKVIRGNCTEYSVPQTSSIISRFEDPDVIYIHIFPNPSHGIITINQIALIQHWQTLSIESPAGQNLIPQKDIRNKTSVTVNLTNLPPGLYFVKMFREDGKIWVMKFIKD